MNGEVHFQLAEKVTLTRCFFPDFNDFSLALPINHANASGQVGFELREIHFPFGQVESRP